MNVLRHTLKWRRIGWYVGLWRYSQHMLIYAANWTGTYILTWIPNLYKHPAMIRYRHRHMQEANLRPLDPKANALTIRLSRTGATHRVAIKCVL